MSNEISPLNESKENNDIEIELGQIIKLIAPGNSELNDKTYYVPLWFNEIIYEDNSGNDIIIN